MQIENEYKNVEAAFHEKGPPYVRWAANMAVGLQTGVPWIMCKQDDAPDPVVSFILLLKWSHTRHTMSEIVFIIFNLYNIQVNLEQTL